MRLGTNATELIKMEKWREKLSVFLVPRDKPTELIKMEKWGEKWTICLAPVTNKKNS